MKSSEFDWGNGKVVYWEINLPEDADLRAELDTLKEDLIQVEYGEELILDVGWYPEFSANGRFVVTLCRRQDWDSPILRGECRELPSLRRMISEAIVVARKESV